jgi:pyruvate ferredoxin oxidoreductase gamma subunit/2-oxoisovalerate ferredoxin oxidoreductase gamma subunit
MLEIRIHGRGGQGAVLASQILGYAFFLQDMYSQSFPTFGAERRGAPVAAFVRVDSEFIQLRSPVLHPNHVLVLSPKLAQTVDVASGLQPGGLLLINSHLGVEQYSHLRQDCQIETMDVSRIALEHGLGSRNMPLVNAPILGAFAGISQTVSLKALQQALPRFIPARVQANAQALQQAFQQAQQLEAS